MFNISNQINNGNLYDPITNNKINLDANIGAYNAPVVIQGDTCPRIYSHASMKNLFREASNNKTHAKNPFTRKDIITAGPPPKAVINYVKKQLSS